MRPPGVLLMPYRSDGSAQYIRSEGVSLFHSSEEVLGSALSSFDVSYTSLQVSLGGVLSPEWTLAPFWPVIGKRKLGKPEHMCTQRTSL